MGKAGKHAVRNRVKKPTAKPVNDKPPTAAELRMPSNAKMIRDLLKSEKRKGNPRDFVVLVGTRLMDYEISYEVVRDDGVEMKAVELVHKRELWKHLGEEAAGKFWNRRLGCRVPTKRKG